MDINNIPRAETDVDLEARVVADGGLLEHGDFDACANEPLFDTIVV